MTNEPNNIVKQAKQGSVAAIIQVLNDKLADSGVRTRAIFENGVLQLLCEGTTLEQLEKEPLVVRIQQILEAIAPRNIRRVNINSRIVREQQLLWLDEIHRDPENQLLWSQEIILKKTNFLKHTLEEWATRDAEHTQSEITRAVSSMTSTQKQRETRQFWRGLLGGTLASVLLLLAGWLLYERFVMQKTPDLQASLPSTSSPSPVSPSVAPVTSPTGSSVTATKPGTDPFAEAVRLAEQTSVTTQTAKSSAEWLSLAAQWQKASDLMAQVPSSDNRFQTAQDRVTTYRKNSEIALEKARQS